MNATQFIVEDGVKKFAIISMRDYREFLEYKEDLNVFFPAFVLDLVEETGCTYIKAWRKYKKFTQKKIAETLGMSQSAYQQIESSNSNKISTLKKVAEALGVTWKHLTLED